MSNNQTTPRGALPLELPALAVSRVAARNTSPATLPGSL